jgi:hypothetical protein
LALNSSNLQKEIPNNKAVSRPLTRTKGEIKEIETVTFNYMLNKLNIPQPELLHLNSAKSPAKVNGMPAFVVRFFNVDKAKEKGITINDYESLSEHPELIVYEGYYVRGKGGEVTIKKWEGVGSPFLEEKIKNGVITEVGLEIPKTAARKWLGRLGKFMLMGGFMLVLIVIVILVVLISIWSKNC